MPDVQRPHSELPNDAETDALVKTITNSLVRLQGWLKPGTSKWSRDGLDALYVLERKYEYMTKTAQSYATERERLVEQLETAQTSIEEAVRCLYAYRNCTERNGDTCNEWFADALRALGASYPASEPEAL